MHSKLALQAREAIHADLHLLTPEQRLEAFLMHCQLVMELSKSHAASESASICEEAARPPAPPRRGVSRTTAAGQSALLLLDAIHHLAGLNLDYAVVGCMAAAVHGLARASEKVQVALMIPFDEVPNLERTFVEAGFQLDIVQTSRAGVSLTILRLTDDFRNGVEVFVNLEGFDARTLRRTVTIPFQGEVVRLVGREDFIAIQAISGRLQDLIDVEAAIAAPGRPLDVDLIRALVSRHVVAAAAIERLLTDSDG